MNSTSGGLRRHWLRSIGLLAALALFVPVLATGASAQTERQPWEGFDFVGNGDAAAPIGADFTITGQDVEFILQQIRVSEAHVQTSTPANPCATLIGNGPNQVPQGDLTQPLGLRVLDGTCNNLFVGNETWGAADQPFEELIAPSFVDAEVLALPFPPPPPNVNGALTTYANPGAGLWVQDSTPRTISNLISDQTTGNPVVAGHPGGVPALLPDGITVHPGGLINIENSAPDGGLSAPFNDMLTYFGQFFDHGLDLTTKNGAPIYMPLNADDPLFVPGGQTNFMVLSRGQDGTDPLNKTTPYVDQNQTYTSHPSHQVFVRDYTAGPLPVSTGFLLEHADGGMSNWDNVQAQSSTVLGITLEDHDLHDVPLLATDVYGNFIPGPLRGLPQIVTPGGLVEGNTAGGGIAIPVDAMRTGHGFVLDIAHHANPGTCDADMNPGTPEVAQTADLDLGAEGLFGDDGDPCTYDDEMLGAHFIAGDGRANENLVLTSIHHVFHAEHNRLVDDILAVATAAGLDSEFTGARLAGEFGNGERLFQAAKFVTEMEYQHLAFEEFARTISPQVHAFVNYDTTINSVISAEFAHAVYRFGHSMLNENVVRFEADGTDNSLTLIDAFVNPIEFRKDSLGASILPEEAAGQLWRGGVTQVGQEIDEFITEALRNNLLGLPLDLPAINIARGRDNGVARLNTVRETFWANGLRPDLAPYDNWADFRFELKNPDSIVNFIAAYGTHADLATFDDGSGVGTMSSRRSLADAMINGGLAAPADTADFLSAAAPYDGDKGGLDNVDLWMGGLAEKLEFDTGAMLGTTFDFIFKTQMENLQDGDRFYYLWRLAGTNLLAQMEGNSLSELAQRNTTAEGLPANVFSRPDFTFDMNAQTNPTGIVDDPATTYDETDLLAREANGNVKFGPGTLSAQAIADGVAGDEHTNWIGSPANDVLESGDGDDTIRGNDGDDRIEGGGGGDNIVGGLGDDIITDSSGDDDIKGGPGDDAISGGPGENLLQGGPGADYILSGADLNETLAGPGNDILHGGFNAAVLIGGEGDDWIEGGGGAADIQADDFDPLELSAFGGNDVMDGQGGDDRMHGEGGHDVFKESPGIDRFEGLKGFDWVILAEGADLNQTLLLPPPFQDDRFAAVEGISGTPGADQLKGDDSQGVPALGLQSLDTTAIALFDGLVDVLPAGTTLFEDGNIILGGAGSDLIEGRGQNDIIDGDVFLDVYLWHPSPAITGGTPSNGGTRWDAALDMQAAIFAGTLDPGEIQIVREIVDPGPGGDVDVAIFQGPQTDYDVTFVGDRIIVEHARGDGANQDGNLDDGMDTLRNIEILRFTDGDFITGVRCNGLLVTFDMSLPVGPGNEATGGDDVILGTSAGEVIVSLGGNDTICGEGGNDTINTGPGNDVAFGGLGDDSIFGLAGDDELHGGPGLDTIVAGTGADNITGGDGADILNGGPDSDVIDGGAGDDDIFGQGGNDTITGGPGMDLIIGLDGIDTINGDAGADIINGGPGDDFLSGGADGDIIYGITGADIIFGNGGNDLLFGQFGNDSIDGGAGDDRIWGNEDQDTIVDPSGLNIINAGSGDDNITGGVDADQIFGDGNVLQLGNDTIDGGLGADLLIGFGGDDTIIANDGVADTVNGGPQANDTCITDAGVDTVFNCELP
ncbi:MAG: Ca2+-binding RTX toxin-like protein [Verrucomicrobiales bacterium]|jgi:Ca2+-binding RTX toxin-like protein